MQKIMPSLLVLSLVLGPWASFADEQLGEIQLADFLVEPTYKDSEKSPSATDSQSGFGLGNSYFAARWKFQRIVSGRIQIADLSLINNPTWYSTTAQHGLGLVEAYAQAESVLGTFRAGLVPISFGLDGATPETGLWFPVSMIFADRQLVLRDYGVSYSIYHNGFFTDVAAHNGEGATDQDKRLWQTARWGWRGKAGTQIGLSGATGYFQTPTSLDTKSRIGNFFFGLDFYAIGIGAEATLGERKTSASQHQFYDWYVWVRHAMGRNWGLMLKYEYYDPSNRIEADGQKIGVAGLYINNDTNTSRLSFMYTKNWEEAEDQIANDEYRVVWRITSSYSQ